MQHCYTSLFGNLALQFQSCHFLLVRQYWTDAQVTEGRPPLCSRTSATSLSPLVVHSLMCVCALHSIFSFKLQPFFLLLFPSSLAEQQPPPSTRNAVTRRREEHAVWSAVNNTRTGLVVRRHKKGGDHIIPVCWAILNIIHSLENFRQNPTHHKKTRGVCSIPRVRRHAWQACFVVCLPVPGIFWRLAGDDR